MLAISHSVHCVRVSGYLGTVRICFDANKCSFSIDFNLLPLYIYIYYCNHKPANKASDYVKTITCMDVIWLIGLGARKIQNFEGGRALPTETRISNAVMDDMKCDEMYL